MVTLFGDTVQIWPTKWGTNVSNVITQFLDQNAQLHRDILVPPLIAETFSHGEKDLLNVVTVVMPVNVKPRVVRAKPTPVLQDTA